MTKTIKIDPVTRIEGHARILLDCDDNGTVEEAFFCVNELRGFERILVGMEAHTLPQVTARICGVCPTAHHLVAAKALDHAAGVEIPRAARLLRELMYMGHFIHSHALSLFILAGPDLVFGLHGESATQNIVAMVDKEPELTKKGLRLRSLGQKINEILGGRGIHPVTAVAGGMSYSFTDGRLQKLREMTAETVALIRELSSPIRELLFRLFDENTTLLENLNIPSWYLGTADSGSLNFYDGTLVALDDKGNIRQQFNSTEYRNYLVERAVSNSYAKEVYFLNDNIENMYRVSTLARLNIVDQVATPFAGEEFELFKERFGRPCHNSVVHMYAKLVELLYACERAEELVHDPAIMSEARVPADFKGKRGVAHIEAPRGTLIHDYEIDERGIVARANMVIATQQNTAAINQSLKQGANSLLTGEDEAVLNSLEFIVRCYDPCLACSTHAIGQMEMEVLVRNKDGLMRRIKRGDR